MGKREESVPLVAVARPTMMLSSGEAKPVPDIILSHATQAGTLQDISEVAWLSV